MIDRIASVSGKEKDIRHYEALLQQLAELFILRQVLSFPWSFEAVFDWEPGSRAGKKNPEIIVRGGPIDIAYEVKAPGLINYASEHRQKKIQVADRGQGLKQIAETFMGVNNVSLPRDNTLKDFLISANDKFSVVKAEGKPLCGLLVVLWDDFIYEPISSLVSPNSGLLTPQSFLRDKATEKVVKFPSVDGVVVIRHLRQFMNACVDGYVRAAHLPLLYGCRHAMDFDYGLENSPKVFIPNPYGGVVCQEALSCLQAVPLSPDLPDAYRPSELIFWFNLGQG